MNSRGCETFSDPEIIRRGASPAQPCLAGLGQPDHVQGRLAPSANASDLSIEREVGGIACDATRIGSRRVMSRAFGMLMRGLAREGRRVRHQRYGRDRDQR